MGDSVTDSKRNKIYDELADLMIEAMSRGEVDLKEAKEMGAFILGKLDNVKLESELFSFIEALCTKWNVYGKVLTELKAEKEATESQRKIDELQKKISSLMN